MSRKGKVLEELIAVITRRQGEVIEERIAWLRRHPDLAVRRRCIAVLGSDALVDSSVEGKDQAQPTSADVQETTPGWDTEPDPTAEEAGRRGRVVRRLDEERRVHTLAVGEPYEQGRTRWPETLQAYFGPADCE